MPCADPEADFRGSSITVGAAREGKFAFALVQAATGHMHSEQAGRTRRVHRDRGTVEPQGVGDPPGRQAEIGAGEPVRPLQGAGIGGQQFVVAMRQSDEHTGLTSRPPSPG